MNGCFLVVGQQTEVLEVAVLKEISDGAQKEAHATCTEVPP
jgi:hypothetical protein